MTPPLASPHAAGRAFSREAGDVLLARQPMVDRDARLRGYELLPRCADGRVPEGLARDAAIAQVLLDPDGLRAVGPHRAWLRVSASLLLELDPLPLDPARVVLQLSPDEPPTQELLARLRALRADRYAIALDGPGERLEARALLEVVSAVKLDVDALGVDGVRAAAARLAPQRLTTVAVGVESPAKAGACLAADCHLLQGWHVGKAEIVGSRRAPAATQAALAAFADVARPDATFEDVERVVSADPALTVTLLRLLNSAAYAGRRTVSTVREALVTLGSERVRQWACVILVVGAADGEESLTAAALARSHMMGLLATAAGLNDGPARTIGLLSVADRLLGLPRADALADLPLDDDVRAALGDGHGPFGQLLRVVLAAERGMVHDGDPDAVAAAQREAFAWAEERLVALRGG